MKGLGFTVEQIISIVSHGGGSHNLAAVKNNYRELSNFGFKAQQIVRMVSRHGGSHNLECIMNYLLEIGRSEFQCEDIIIVTANDRQKLINRLKAETELQRTGHENNLVDGFDFAEFINIFSMVDEDIPTIPLSVATNRNAFFQANATSQALPNDILGIKINL